MCNCLAELCALSDRTWRADCGLCTERNQLCLRHGIQYGCNVMLILCPLIRVTVLHVLLAGWRLLLLLLLLVRLLLLSLVHALLCAMCV